MAASTNRHKGKEEPCTPLSNAYEMANAPIKKKEKKKSPSQAKKRKKRKARDSMAVTLTLGLVKSTVGAGVVDAVGDGAVGFVIGPEGVSDSEGAGVGAVVGERVGTKVGAVVGECVERVGAEVGAVAGEREKRVGAEVEEVVGERVERVGAEVGAVVGERVGAPVPSAPVLGVADGVSVVSVADGDGVLLLLTAGATVVGERVGAEVGAVVGERVERVGAEVGAVVSERVGAPVLEVAVGIGVVSVADGDGVLLLLTARATAVGAAVVGVVGSELSTDESSTQRYVSSVYTKLCGEGPDVSLLVWLMQASQSSPVSPGLAGKL